MTKFKPNKYVKNGNKDCFRLVQRPQNDYIDLSKLVKVTLTTSLVLFQILEICEVTSQNLAKVTSNFSWLLRWRKTKFLNFSLPNKRNHHKSLLVKLHYFNARITKPLDLQLDIAALRAVLFIFHKSCGHQTWLYVQRLKESSRKNPS